MSIEILRVSKTFEEFRALDDISLQIAKGELVALLGPSGSGKTTLLRIIAGLETPDLGDHRLLFDGKDVGRTRAQNREVGLVPQHYALFRHMTVFDNVAFGLRVKPRKLRPQAREIARRVHDLLELVKLQDLGHRYPHQISGGQMQRVALARALAVDPKVLLLDEPFGALDARVRQELRRWLRGFHKEISVTSLFVTHDQNEALEVADRIVVMNDGRIEQVGTPHEVFHEPATPFVMGFLGEINRFEGRLESGKGCFGSFVLEPGVCGHHFSLGADETQTAELFARPHDLLLTSDANGHPGFRAEVVRVHAAGSLVRVELRDEMARMVLAEIPHESHDNALVQPGRKVAVGLRRSRTFPMK